MSFAQRRGDVKTPLHRKCEGHPTQRTQAQVVILLKLLWGIPIPSACDVQANKARDHYCDIEHSAERLKKSCGSGLWRHGADIAVTCRGQSSEAEIEQV